METVKVNEAEEDDSSKRQNATFKKKADFAEKVVGQSLTVKHTLNKE